MTERSAWHDWQTAAVYQSYIDDYPIYPLLNARLAELACLDRARRVLDLACGTGATARRCLERMPQSAELVGVDQSVAMVALARAEVQDPRASFEVSGATRLEEVVDGPFDRVVCNAAFWQLPSPDAVLAALVRVLEPGALFVFNVPAEKLADQPDAVHPFQIALSRALAEEMGHRPSEASDLDPDFLDERLEDAGFELVATERFVYSGLQGELVELMRIPAMMASLAPDLRQDQRSDAVEAASRRVDEGLAVEVPWIYYTVRRR